MTEPEVLAEGRYTLLEPLGEGGMAVVWRAHDARLDCERAVKLLQPRLASVAELRARFEAEARTMARLSHPNIVAVHDVGEDRGRIYIVMELLEGGTLNGWLVEHGAMPPRLAVDVVRGVLGAVSAAHEAGVVHRDLKPQNVLLSRRGTPKVADFGIAHVTQQVGGPATPTRTGQVLGTLGFMPPEQRLGARGLDGRADLYAVGAMLYTLTTAEPPPDLFASGEDEAMLAAVPPALLPVIVRATRYKPETRFGTAEEMLAELDRLRPSLPEPPPDTPPLVAPGRPRGPATGGASMGTGARSQPGGRVSAGAPSASETFATPASGTLVAAETAPAPPVRPTPVEPPPEPPPRVASPPPVVPASSKVPLAIGLVAGIAAIGIAAAWIGLGRPAPEPAVDTTSVPAPVTAAPPAPVAEAPVPSAPEEAPTTQAASAPVAAPASPAGRPASRPSTSAAPASSSSSPASSPAPSPEPVVAEAASPVASAPAASPEPKPEVAAAPAPAPAPAAVPEAPATKAASVAPAAACVRAGSFQGRADGRPFSLVVTTVDGSAVKAQGRSTLGQTVRTFALSGTCEGDRLTLAESGGDGMRFSGIVSGTTIAGTVTVGGRSSAWSVQAR